MMRVQLEVLQGWLQEKENEYQRHGWRMRKWVRWNLLQKIWNVKLINELRELEKRHIEFFEKERLKGIESKQKGSVENQKVHCERLVLEASNEAERSCIFKNNYFCMIAGTSQDDEQLQSLLRRKSRI